MPQRKKVLFVINTLGQGGAESAFIQFMKKFDPKRFQLFLYVIVGQGELINRVPKHVVLLNRHYDSSDVLSVRGKRLLMEKTLMLMLRNGAVFKNFPFLIRNASVLSGDGRHHPERLLWQVLADGCPSPGQHFDLGIAYLEGAATYYLDRRVDADRKIAFVHTDYVRSGNDPRLDRGVYDRINKIYCVSEQTVDSFLKVYPQYAHKTEVFRNIIDMHAARRKARRSSFFDKDGYTGTRIVSLGRLIRMKAVDKSIAAMRILKDAGIDARWYVFGEGSARPYFESLIDENDLRDCFFLPGAVENPFPYLRKADIYCQCSDYEGRSVAISEAMLMSCAVITSNHSGSAGQVHDGQDGLLIEPTPENIADAIMKLISDPELAKRLGKAAAERMSTECDVGDFNRMMLYLNDRIN